MIKFTNPPVIILMGVSGSGKSTVGQILSDQTGIPFYDGDDFHPEVNKEKMSIGHALNDNDRWPWLMALANHLESKSDEGAIIACSALKEIYREFLLKQSHAEVNWILLHGSKTVLEQRLKERKGHFFDLSLLSSQLEILEVPDYARKFDIANPPEQIAFEIIKSISAVKSEIGLIGLGVMGKSLTLNLANHDISVSAYNRSVPGEENVVSDFRSSHQNIKHLHVFSNMREFIDSLEKPTKLILMVSAGEVVDHVLNDLLPFLNAGDIVVDAGNSHEEDTSRRIHLMEQREIHFLGCGVSGGEEGALKGPSIMPGGRKTAYQKVEKYLEAIAAKDYAGRPCCAYIGAQGSGHFVKIIHNGIEYGEMQLIAEIYSILHEGASLPKEEIADLFKAWNQGALQSYLLEITGEIVAKKEANQYLVDVIYDSAEQKGTGGWSTTAALDMSMPFSTISEAVMARHLSSLKPKRIWAAQKYGKIRSQLDQEPDELLPSLKKAYEAARIINHAIGFEMIRKKSDVKNWGINLSELARIWTNGCIIRSSLMEDLVEYYHSEPNTHLLLMDDCVKLLTSRRNDLARVVASGLQNGLALPVLSAAVNYLNGFTSAQSSANIIQAQRDYFGAHTYKRKDSPLEQTFHTDWKKI